MSTSQLIRVIVFRDGDSWIAQCLEHDICAQAGDLKTLKLRLELTFEAELDLCVKSGRDLDAIPAAPKYFFDKWNECSGFEQMGHANGLNFEMALCA